MVKLLNPLLIKSKVKYIDISTFNKNYIRESVKSEQNHIIDNDDNIIAFKCKICGYKANIKMPITTS
jgi:hypothetical protein